ncbi:MAG: hypothetical protein K0R18_1823, partial [Bacillales bacterium]|nr:hypothetical protein [Bacillales bacterium]
MNSFDKTMQFSFHEDSIELEV